jgi:dUTP pyrophosphatase
MDYRGEIGIIVRNEGGTPFIVQPGMRIAQMLISPVYRIVWEEVKEISSTERGTGGFGSTGI